MSLYGCQLWDYSNESVLASVFVTWRKCVRNIFSIPYNTHCNLVHLIAQDSSVRVKLHKRYLKFFNNASKSNNTLVSMMSRLVINGSGSAACRFVNFICSTYDLNKYDISLSLLSKLKIMMKSVRFNVPALLWTFYTIMIHILNNLYGKLSIICVL